MKKSIGIFFAVFVFLHIVWLGRRLFPTWESYWYLPATLIFSLVMVYLIYRLVMQTVRQRTVELERINERLNREIADREQGEQLQRTLYKIARITHSGMAFPEIYQAIHTHIGRLMEAENFYIALYDAADETIFLAYFVDEKDDYDGRRYKAGRGLTEYVIRTGASLLADAAAFDALLEKGDVESVGSPSEIWLGVPLIFKGKTFGALVVQHYTNPGAYSEKDKEMLEFVSGQIAAVIHSKREEEEKEALLQKLAASEKMEAIGRLAGGVAHDLNNVLSAIVSYPELLLLKLPGHSPMRKPLLTMKRSGERAAAIVQDLLTLARRGVDVKEVVNWNDIINDHLKTPEFEKLKTQHPGVDIKIHLEHQLLNIQGSPVHLSKALLNLCSNAAEAMPAGGALTLSTRNLYPDDTFEGFGIANYVVVGVVDTGIGIPGKDLKRIFEPFYTRKEMGVSGTGLGMAIVWNTVHDHGGFINVGSKEGEGATFELFFPVTKAVAAKHQKNVGIQDYMGGGEQILVIDDAQEQREILSVLLNELGYFVDSVPSGEEAVEYLKNHSVDLVVLDMIMEPGMDGLDTYRRILDVQPGTPAVIASGFSETDRVKEAIRLGAGAYIKKPYTLESIGVAIKRELRKKEEGA